MRRRAKKNAPSSKKSASKRALPAVRKTVRKIVRRVVRKTLKAAKTGRETVLAGPDFPPNAAPSAPAAWEDKRLPLHYGEDRIALMVRDPWWIFAYWELTPRRQQEVARQIEDAGLHGKKIVLRVYDVTGLSLPRSHSFFDIELNFYADNWYIDVGLPDREWVAEVGFRAAGGRFFPMVRSNRVRTPAFGLSDVLDEEWMLPEDVYYRLIGRSLGESARGSSLDIRRLLEKYLKNVVSSENAPSRSVKSHIAGAAIG